MAATRPNIVLIVGEDTGPHLGCFGDGEATTPNLDRLASEGAIFPRCFTHAPVCAPSRSGLVTGRYPISFGSHHMRSTVLDPPRLFTQDLRDAGYHVSWPTKLDFNFEPPADWRDDDANWFEQDLPGQPFFAFVNLGVTHESQIRADDERYRANTARLTPEEFHDPASVAVPPYFPDTPEVRRDLARHHDNVTALDHQVGDILAHLEAQGVADNTVVIFTSDHGRGMPRHKRWCYDGGIREPLIIRWPGTIDPGTRREDLIAFVDLAPTILAIAGAPIAEGYQGQVVLGPQAAGPRTYAFAHRDRMDESYDRIRVARSARYKYIRNERPDLPWCQRIRYMEEMPTMQVWRRKHAAGELGAVQAAWFAELKPGEELYDLDQDPHEIHNLAADPAHQAILREHRRACDEWRNEVGDLGLLTERELIERGIVANRLDGEYLDRIARLPDDLQPAGGPWDCLGRPWRG